MTTICAFHTLTSKPDTRAKYIANIDVSAMVRSGPALRIATHTDASAARLIIRAPAASPAVRDPVAA